MNNLEENIGVIFEKKDYAGLIKRVIIDAVDLFVILLISAAFYLISDEFISDDETLFKSILIFTMSFSAWYLGVLKRSKLGTLGFIVTGVKIVDLSGRKPSILKMALRVSLLILGPLELIVDIIWLTSEKTKQTLRDKYVGTYVVNKNALPIGTGKLHTVLLDIMGWNMMYREIKESAIK